MSTRLFMAMAAMGLLHQCAAPVVSECSLDYLVDPFGLLELSHHRLSPEGPHRNEYGERADAGRDRCVDTIDVSLLADGRRMPEMNEPAVGWEWIETGFNYILTDIEFPAGQSQIGYAVGESLTYRGEGIVIKTVDGGDTWMRLTPEGIPGLEAMSFPDLQTGYAGGWNDYVIRTVDGGATWDAVAVASGMVVIGDIAFRDPNHGVLVEGENVHITEDGGETWTTGTGMIRVCYEVTFAHEETLFAVGADAYVFKSTDDGYTWTTVRQGVQKELLLGVDFLNADYGMAVGDYSTILSTMDGGETWSRIPFPGDLLLESVFIQDVNTAYLCGTPEYVFKTTDGGAVWKSDYDGNWQRAFNRIRFTADGTGFICGSSGIVLRKAGLKIPSESAVPTDRLVVKNGQMRAAAQEGQIRSGKRVYLGRNHR